MHAYPADLNRVVLAVGTAAYKGEVHRACEARIARHITYITSYLIASYLYLIWHSYKILNLVTRSPRFYYSGPKETRNILVWWESKNTCMCSSVFNFDPPCFFVDPRLEYRTRRKFIFPASSAYFPLNTIKYNCRSPSSNNILEVYM